MPKKNYSQDNNVPHGDPTASPCDSPLVTRSHLNASKFLTKRLSGNVDRILLTENDAIF